MTDLENLSPVVIADKESNLIEPAILFHCYNGQITKLQLPTTNYQQPPTTDYQLPITDHRSPITDYLT